MATLPVDPYEVVYRQIGPGGSPLFFDQSRQCPIHQSLFLPHRGDTDGLSLIRAAHRSEVWSAYRLERPDVRYRLARFTAQVVVELANSVGIVPLNIEPNPDALDLEHGEPWAHCVLREINRTDYDSDRAAKLRIKEWALAMADQLGHSDVLGEFPPPTASVPYRP
jgi:hypothetical protein